MKSWIFQLKDVTLFNRLSKLWLSLQTYWISTKMPSNQAENKPFLFPHTAHLLSSFPLNDPNNSHSSSDLSNWSPVITTLHDFSVEVRISPLVCPKGRSSKYIPPPRSPMVIWPSHIQRVIPRLMRGEWFICYRLRVMDSFTVSDRAKLVIIEEIAQGETFLSTLLCMIPRVLPDCGFQSAT